MTQAKHKAAFDILVYYYVIMIRSIFSQILTINTPYLAREGELWGVCCWF